MIITTTASLNPARLHVAQSRHATNPTTLASVQVQQATRLKGSACDLRTNGLLAALSACGPVIEYAVPYLLFLHVQ